MIRIGAVIIGACALVIVTQGPVQAQTAGAPGLSVTSNPGSVTLPVETNRPQLHPLIVAGQVGVYVWAPVEPAYNARADRNRAADPLWEAEGPGSAMGP